MTGPARLTLAAAARMRATANAARAAAPTVFPPGIRAPGGKGARHSTVSVPPQAPPAPRSLTRDGRVPASKAAALTELGRRADAMRFRLNDDELRELDLLAFAAKRRRDRPLEQAARQLALKRLGQRAARVREFGLVASMGAPDAPVAHWQGVIGVEGSVTGDGRLIEAGALEWAVLPLPLRWAPADFGGHDGAVLVGRIDAIERRKDGSIFASGVLDLGSAEGRESARLIGSGMLTGVSMDLDSSEVKPATSTPTATQPDPSKATAQNASVTTSGRVRAATLVAIPAFDEARIELTDAPDDAPASTAQPLECGRTSRGDLHAAPEHELPDITNLPNPWDKSNSFTQKGARS